MKKSEQPENLFSEFPNVPVELWENQIMEDLKGADYKEKLKWDTLEGIAPLPFYTQQDLNTISLNQFPTGTSLKTSLITEYDLKEANKQIKEFKDQGITTCLIKSNVIGQVTPHGGHLTGTQIHSLEDINKLLQGVDLESVGLIFDTGVASPLFASMLLEGNLKPTHAKFIYDPFSYIAQHGRLPLPLDQLKLFVNQLAVLKDVEMLAADCLPHHLSGATIVQELGIMLATASEYLTFVDESNRVDAAKSFFTRLSTGPLYFPEIAKFRATRILWSNLLEAYDLDVNLPLFIHAETTPQNKTVSDAYNNLLRSTTEAMSAIIGGADSVLVLPHDINYQKPDRFSNRIARNILHISDSEAYLSKTTDPSSGSYYIEKLTYDIATKAWDFFKEIEGRGGLLKALEQNFIQSEIHNSGNQKMKAYATRGRTLTGTNHYPNSAEKLPDDQYTEFSNPLSPQTNSVSINTDKLFTSLTSAFKDGASISDVAESVLSPQKVLFETLSPFNPGKLFDDIRKRTDRHQKSSDKRPVVTMIIAGDKKWGKARANFASNIFGCAGFEINTSDHDFLDTETVKKITGDIFVLCSSDEDYDDLVQKFCQTFNDRRPLILAGNPKEQAAAYSKQGIDHFMMQGMDIIQFLTTLQDQLFNTEGL